MFGLHQAGNRKVMSVGQAGGLIRHTILAVGEKRYTQFQRSDIAYSCGYTDRCRFGMSGKISRLSGSLG